VVCRASAANVADVKVAPVILVPALEANAKIEKILADSSYQGSLGDRLKICYDCTLEIGQRRGQGFRG